MTKPTCCGQPAKWVHINHRMEYWYCEKCKNEVQEKKAPETPDDDNIWWYPGLQGYTPPSAGVYRRTGSAVAFSGGLVGGAAPPANPAPPLPTPLVLGEIAQFTGAMGVPCYFPIHCWSSKTNYDMGASCTCGQRVKDLSSAPTSCPGPISLDPTCEQAICDDPSPCTSYPAVHFWAYRYRYEASMPCNCGLRLKY